MTFAHPPLSVVLVDRITGKEPFPERLLVGCFKRFYETGGVFEGGFWF